MANASRIFKTNRALGYVSNNIPLVVRFIKKRNENLVTTCVGKCFHVYGCKSLTLLKVSKLHPSDICCLAGDEYYIYTAADNVVYAWRGATHLEHTYVGHEKSVHILLPFGTHLISVDASSALKVWIVKQEELFLELFFSNDTFQITTVIHPSTYLNKILLGSKQGAMQLWNINTSKLIYTFKGWGCEITVLEQAPAVDVVAVGLANGRIVLHNLKYDESVMEFIQDWGSVTSISFRLDGQPTMISGSPTGCIIIWNLEEKRMFRQMEEAHLCAVSGIQCLPSEPLFITSSPDNSLKMWIFDMSDGSARMLRQRTGHAFAPTFIRYYGADGRNILSAGGDSTLRVFSTVNENLHNNFGTATKSYIKSKNAKKDHREDCWKLPCITHFSAETTREKEWDNIAAIHLNERHVSSWSYYKQRIGLKPLYCDGKKGTFATAVCITACGNFVVIGYSSGEVVMFNMQSGIHQGKFGNKIAHKTAVRGVATDGLNQVTVTADSQNITFWPFKPQVESKLSMKTEETILFFSLHRESSLLAVALEDYSIDILDLDTQTKIRKFIGHTCQIMDLAFSSDSRWLFTASMDCTIRTWDIPTANLIDCFQVDTPCTSLSLSPTGDMLATAHMNRLGLYLWSNKTLYSHVSLRPIPENAEFPLVDLPTTLQKEEETQEDNIDDLLDNEFKSPEQISEDLITLSSLANSRWQNLLNIDTVRKRNKPRDAPKKPQAAPFFLPTIPSLDLQFDLSKKDDTSSDVILPSSTLQSFTVFGRMLKDSVESNDFQTSIEKLKQLGPSAINFEINSLSPEGGGSTEIMLQFMKLIEHMLLSNKDFELAQSYLGLFLKTHGDLVSSDKELRDYLLTLEHCQMSGWESLQDKLLYSLCVVQSLKIM